MSSINSIFPPVVLSETEEVLIGELFSNPLVKKYLRVLAQNDSKELLGIPLQSNSAESIVVAHATIQGRLQTIVTLLSIGDSNQGAAK